MTHGGDTSKADALFHFASNRDQIDPVMTESTLQNALANLGYDRIAGPDATPRKKRAIPGAIEFVLFTFWASAAAVIGFLGLPWWLMPLAIIVVIMAFGGIVSVQNERYLGFGVGGLLGLTALGFFYAITENETVLMFGYVIPAGIALVAAIIIRRVLVSVRDVAMSMGGVSGGVPLVAPLVLIFLFFPLISQETWQVAEWTNVARLAVLTVLSVGAMYVLVLRKLRSELDPVAERRIVELTAADDRILQTKRSVAASLGKKDDQTAALNTVRDDVLQSCWPDSAMDLVPLLAEVERDALLKPLKYRMAATTIAVFVLISIYVYLVAIVAVPIDLAETWSESNIQKVAVFGEVLPVDVYFRVAFLMGIVGTAGFLAFVVIEDRFAAAMTTALLRRPLDRFLSLAIPLIHLRDRSLGAADVQPPSNNAAGHSTTASLDLATHPDE